MIRKPRQEDLEKLLEIYNEAILSGTASFEEVPLSLEEGNAWMESFDGIYSMLVFEKNSAVLGYITLSPFGKKRDTAYYITAELSLYIDKEARGMGLGKTLMNAMIEKAREDDKLETIVSIITEGNAGSVALHEKMGFMYCGKLEHVARKSNQLLSILFYQKHINENTST